MKPDIYKYYFLSILLISLMGCETKPTRQQVKETFIGVQTAVVENGSIDQYSLFNGITKYQRKEDIRANVTGYLSKINYDIGSPINKGQILCYIRTKEQDALRDAIKLDSSLAKLTKPIPINSKATGVVSGINFNENSFVSEGDIIVTIVQPNSLTIQASIPFGYSKNIIKGTPCEVILKDSIIRTKIDRPLPIIDPLTQNQQFLIELPEIVFPENLKVQIRILGTTVENAKVIPKSAIQTNELQTRFWVMKVLHDSLAVKTYLDPLLENDSLVQIQSTALRYGDTIIVSGAYQLQDSTIVRIENPKP